MLPQQRDRLRQNVIARESGNREGFLSRGCMPGLPGIRDPLELIDHPFEALRRDHLEFEPVAPAALQGIAEAGSAGAIEAKARQRETCLLADLQRLETGIEVDWQALRRDL